MSETLSTSPILDDAARSRAHSAASWGAILAGAAVAVALSLVLMTLGAGLGFASVSPWSEHGQSAGAFTVATTIWLIVTQWLSAAVGGYLAGRLRHRWLATHTHEVFFRDTAHGLVTWAVATLFVTAVLADSVTSLVGGGARAAGGLAAAGGQGAAVLAHSEMPGPRGVPGPDTPGSPGGAYNLDKLFRSSLVAPGVATAAAPVGAVTPAGTVNGADPRLNDARAEVMHIAANAATTGAISDDDRAYLATLIAAKTGVSTDEANKRVDAFIQSINDVGVRAKSAADEAREAAASAALYAALALLIGAFIASVSAVIGGRLRDEHL